MSQSQSSTSSSNVDLVLPIAKRESVASQIHGICDKEDDVVQPAPKQRRTTSYQFGEYFTLKLIKQKSTGIGWITKDNEYLIGCGPHHSEDSLVVIEALYDELERGLVRPYRCNVEHARTELISHYHRMRELGLHELPRRPMY